LRPGPQQPADETLVILQVTVATVKSADENGVYANFFKSQF
jgi:hypothetical protein